MAAISFLEMVRMENEFRDLANKAMALLCVHMDMSMDALKNGSYIEFLAVYKTTDDALQQLIDMANELNRAYEDVHNSIMELAESIGVSCDA